MSRIIIYFVSLRRHTVRLAYVRTYIHMYVCEFGCEIIAGQHEFQNLLRPSSRLQTTNQSDKMVVSV